MTKIKHLFINGAEYDYSCFGSGKTPFIMIPGLSIKSILGSVRSIEAAYEPFLEDYTIYLFDKRKEYFKGIKIDDFAEDIYLEMKELGIEKAVVFGVSQGGMIAQALAANHPECVSRLILGSTASRIDEQSHKMIDNWLEIAKKYDATALCKSFIEAIYSEDFINKYGKIIIAMHKDCTAEELEKFRLSVEAFEGFNIIDRLKNVTCPALVIGAENDRIFSTARFKETAEALNAELFIYPAPYGHTVYDEAPDYKDKMLKFLNN